MTSYNTNLAPEYYILSCLHRRGLDANLTLCNKKGADIVVIREASDSIFDDFVKIKQGFNRLGVGAFTGLAAFFHKKWILT